MKVDLTAKITKNRFKALLSTPEKLGLLFSSQEKKQFTYVALLITGAAMVETLGVASILPYASLLTSPDSELSLRVHSVIGAIVGTTDIYYQNLFAGAIVLCSLTVGTAITALSTWISLKFTMTRSHSLSQRILHSYCERPYIFFSQNHSTLLTSHILSETSSVIGGVLIPMMQLFARTNVIIFLLILIVLANPLVSLISLSAFASLYSIVYFATRGSLSKYGFAQLAHNRERYHILSELFAGIREIKFLESEQYYKDKFASASYRFSEANALSQIIALMPKYFIETLAFGGVVASMMYVTATDEGIMDSVPLLALYAVAGYKILPSMQQIFVNLSSIRAATPALDALVNVIAYPSESVGHTQIYDNSKHRLEFSKCIELKNVVYKYVGNSEFAVGPLSFSIPAFSTVAIVGPSGCGKSTTLDLILGLISPSSGVITIDDRELSGSLTSEWRSIIGLVPQDIHIIDATVAENIAYGVSKSEIDLAKVYAAAKTAQAYEFVIKMPRKFDTVLQERGSRLSGGQRQRIAIARALYREPQVLVFDEATSALDTDTEEALLGAIRVLAHKKTIIVVTHREATLTDCDIIIHIDAGKLAGITKRV